MCGPSRRNGSRFSARSRSAISRSTSLIGSSAAGSCPDDGFVTLNYVPPLPKIRAGDAIILPSTSLEWEIHCSELRRICWITPIYVTFDAQSKMLPFVGILRNCCSHIFLDICGYWHKPLEISTLIGY